MLILNFSHPLTSEQLDQIERMCFGSIEEVRGIQTQIDNGLPLVPQIIALADACNLSPKDWQRCALLVVPPALSVIAIALLAEIHGRAGYFPPIVRICPTGDIPPRYVVREIVNLQDVRENARLRRIQ